MGICSTTYGDLVCRGCKRYAHEIVGWNGYLESQRELVWSRLHKLLGESVRAHVRIIDEDRLRDIAQQAKVPDASRLPADVLAFETMRFSPMPLDAMGLATRPTEQPLHTVTSPLPGSARGHPSHESLQPGSARGYPSQKSLQRGSARGYPSHVKPKPLDVRDVLLAIDREFYLRSRAHFEASFKALS